jgi:predicted DsbA family dithiol-disulfide isomerase
MTRSFSVNWDYRCPFARNAHDHLVTALRHGADWDVTFRVFSLDQAHVAEGGTAVWDEPEAYPGLVANLAGVVVRERMPEHFLDVHDALFSARHDDKLDLRDRQVLVEVLDGAGVDGSKVVAEADGGWPLETLRTEHSDMVERLHVFGVPTFMTSTDAVFVRLMQPARGDAQGALSTIERVLDLVTDWPDLNEFKHTVLPG